MPRLQEGLVVILSQDVQRYQGTLGNKTLAPITARWPLLKRAILRLDTSRSNTEMRKGRGGEAWSFRKGYLDNFNDIHPRVGPSIETLAGETTELHLWWALGTPESSPGASGGTESM